MLYIDLTTTAHTWWQSGIQGVSRQLYGALRERTTCEPVIFDRYAKVWRAADDRELRFITAPDTLLGGPKPERNWSWWQKTRGRARRKLGISTPKQFGSEDSLVIPELFGMGSERDIAGIREACGGPVVAVFHDAIALRRPQWSPELTVQSFPGYLQTLRTLDGIAAVSTASAEELRTYWDWQDREFGRAPCPPVTVISLGTALHSQDHEDRSASQPEGRIPMVLFVATVEARKNHLAVLDAAEMLWKEGLAFRLVMAGGSIPEAREAFFARLATLRDHPLEYLGKIPSDHLHRLYREAHCTVYPSLYEGFGMPVLESHAFGKPCLTTERGGLRDFVHDGGCEIVEPTVPGIAAGLRRLLAEPAHYRILADQAAQRTFRSWDDYTADLLAWMESLPKRQ